jgi:uncharacterized lipoprotein YbaY
MRLVTLVPAFVAAVLAACGQSSPPPSSGAAGTQPAEPTGPVVTGTVLAAAPVALSPGATLTVRLLDTTRADSEPTAMTQRTYPVTAIPAEFSLPYSAPDVNSIRSYAVDASVMDQGQVRFISQSRVGVLTQGKPRRATIMLVQAMAAAVPKDPVEELNKEFADFEARLGSLKRLTGERLSGPEGKEVAIGWDAFVDDSGVRMVRERVTYADGGGYNVRFAFKDGKPWVAVKQASGSTTRIGWDADGNAIIKEKDGQATEIGDAEISSLRREARDARSLVAAQSG